MHRCLLNGPGFIKRQKALSRTCSNDRGLPVPGTSSYMTVPRMKAMICRNSWLTNTVWGRKYCTGGVSTAHSFPSLINEQRSAPGLHRSMTSLVQGTTS